jgi:hypothetical protein
MWTEKRPLLYENEPWAFDNGAYGCFLAGRPFHDDRFRYRLDRASDLPEPLFGVTPDIVGGGLLSLEFSLGWRERLPNHWPWYLVVQDGMIVEDVEPCLDGFEGLFLGGTTRFKSTAETWCELAHKWHKGFHYGRASVLSRVQDAKRIGADSLDTSFPLWTRGRLAEFIENFLHGSRQGELATGPGAMAPRR